ncbi:hypothetical protein RJG79_07820 [Mycoplasmatota bacterium WC44]
MKRILFGAIMFFNGWIGILSIHISHATNMEYRTLLTDLSYHSQEILYYFCIVITIIGFVICLIEAYGDAIKEITRKQK